MDLMEPWNVQYTVLANVQGQINTHRVSLLSEETWVEVVLPNGRKIRINGDGTLEV